MTPTHTHRIQGGRFALVAEEVFGLGVYEGVIMVIIDDIDSGNRMVIDRDTWREAFRPIAKDDCQVCLGSGTDHIKGAKDKPCGGCFGLGKVREDGETPKDRWELAEVAERMIAELHREVAGLKSQLDTPGVAEAIKAEWKRHQQAISDAQARQEREWREGRGHGPGGARMTGD